MHEELWNLLIELDRQKTSRRAKCQYLLTPERYVITLLNTDYMVSLTDRQIFSAPSSSAQAPAEFLEQLCILAYLINAKELPLANKLVKAQSLPGGQFFFRGPHMLPTRKLQKVFAKNPDLLYEASAQLDAKKCDFGDASVQLFALPRIPLTFVIWAGDGEFSARASILFDRTAAAQLPLDALWATVNLTVNTVLSSIPKSS